MPKRTTVKQGFPRDPATCFASRHLSATHFKVYNVIVACAWHWRHKREGDAATGPLIFDASIVPWLCNAVPLSESYARTMVSEIEELGWLVLLKEGERRENGRQAPNTYRVVEHAEFVQTHPNSCPPNGYAPDQETAEQFGVSYGDKISSGPIPKNFWPKEDTTVGRALRKLLAEEPVVLTDDESTALREHFDSFTVTRVQEAVADTSTREAVNADGLQNSGAAASGIQLAPPPEFSSDGLRNSGENLVTALATSSTHPHAQSKSVSVCVDMKTTSTMAEQQTCDPESWVVEMLANQPRDWSLGPKQRPELKAIAKKLGREMFLAVGDAFIKEPPEIINGRTLAPWSFLVPNLEKYILRVEVIRKRKAKEETERPAYDRTMKLYNRKQKVYVHKAWDEFLASLSQEDRDYRAQVEAAATLEELPPDNGKDYDALRTKWWQEQDAKEKARAKDAIGEW